MYYEKILLGLKLLIFKKYKYRYIVFYVVINLYFIKSIVLWD